MNKIFLLGNLVDDIKYAQKQKDDGTMLNICHGTIAVNTRSKDKNGNYISEFFDFTCFTESMKDLKKGTKLLIEGRLQSDSFKSTSVFRLVTDPKTNIQSWDPYTIKQTQIIVSSWEYAQKKETPSVPGVPGITPAPAAPAAPATPAMPVPPVAPAAPMMAAPQAPATPVMPAAPAMPMPQAPAAPMMTAPVPPAMPAPQPPVVPAIPDLPDELPFN